MPNINTMKDSKFLKKENCEPPILVTIRGVHQENVAMQGAPEDLKWCVAFDEEDKPMVLNSTNAQLIAKIIGSEETDDWTGHKVVLYNDPSVSYGGKVMGGIRVRAPKQPRPAAQPAPKPVATPAKTAPTEPDENDVPF